mmetsp:Transcript_27343/g.44431  ORF Transcript_27343/g.44431 Transcript_27343/m.44431 type:complete len:94 (-) Transcript_27343:16-297(-)
MKQVECNDLRNGVEHVVAAPRNVKAFPADERDKCLAILKPRDSPKLRVEAMIAIDTAPRDGFMIRFSSSPQQILDRVGCTSCDHRLHHTKVTP